MQRPSVAAIGITQLYETLDFLLQMVSSSPSVTAAPTLLVTSSALSLSSLARCLLLAVGDSKRDNLSWPPLSYWKAGRTCDQLLASWDLEHCRQMTGPAWSPAPAHPLTRWENLAVGPLGGRRSNLTRANAPTTVLCDSSSTGHRSPPDNEANSVSHKMQTTCRQTTAIFLGCGITLGALHIPPQGSPFCSLKWWE